jgi:hypothetical protein
VCLVCCVLLEAETEKASARFIEEVLPVQL